MFASLEQSIHVALRMSLAWFQKLTTWLRFFRGGECVNVGNLIHQASQDLTSVMMAWTGKSRIADHICLVSLIPMVDSVNPAVNTVGSKVKLFWIKCKAMFVAQLQVFYSMPNWGLSIRVPEDGIISALGFTCHVNSNVVKTLSVGVSCGVETLWSQ